MKDFQRDLDYLKNSIGVLFVSSFERTRAIQHSIIKLLEILPLDSDANPIPYRKNIVAYEYLYSTGRTLSAWVCSIADFMSWFKPLDESFRQKVLQEEITIQKEVTQIKSLKDAVQKH